MYVTQHGQKTVGTSGAFDVLEKSSHSKETFRVIRAPQSIPCHGTHIKITLVG